MYLPATWKDRQIEVVPCNVENKDMYIEGVQNY